MPHQCGPSWDAPGDCIGLVSNMLFFTDGSVYSALVLLLLYSFDHRNALGIPNFNYSNVALNFTASWQNFLAFGFEQSLSMEILEMTRSGQINLFGRESDVLYPFDWYVPLDLCRQRLQSQIRSSHRYRVQFLVAAVSPSTNGTVPMAGASIFNPDQTEWRASTVYKYLDDLNGQATKLTVSVTLGRHIIVKISAFLILTFNCEWTLRVIIQ